MRLFDNIKSEVPQSGFILKKWEQRGAHRATAHAYMKRENVNFIENSNGNIYSISQIENAMIGFKK
jgi:hypothetical protein